MGVAMLLIAVVLAPVQQAVVADRLVAVVSG